MSRQQSRMKSSSVPSSTLDVDGSFNHVRGGQLPAETLQQACRLMEGTIEFVDQQSYRLSNAMQLIQANRPDLRIQTQERPHGNHCRTYLSSLVTKSPFSLEEERYWFELMNFLKYRAEHDRRLLDLNHLDIAVVKRIGADLDEALRIRNRITESNLRLVVALARRLSETTDQIPDLISEGMSPLIRSVELFNVATGNHFSTYATWSVRNEMLRFLKKHRLIRQSSLNEGSCSIENIPDHRSRNASDESESNGDYRVIHDALASLTEREKLVIEARYGLDGQRRRPSFAAIGAEIGICGERVRQLMKLAVSKLKSEIPIEDF